MLLFGRGQLHGVASTHWTELTDTGRERMSRMAAAASWGLAQWDSMERYMSCIPRDTTDGAFYRAVLAVHREQYAVAQQVTLSSFVHLAFVNLFCRKRIRNNDLHLGIWFRLIMKESKIFLADHTQTNNHCYYGPQAQQAHQKILFC